MSTPVIMVAFSPEQVEIINQGNCSLSIVGVTFCPECDALVPVVNENKEMSRRRALDAIDSHVTRLGVVCPASEELISKYQ